MIFCPSLKQIYENKMNNELPKDIGGYQCIVNGPIELGDIWVSHGLVTGFVSTSLVGKDVQAWRYPGANIYRKMKQPGHHQPEVVQILKEAGLRPSGCLNHDDHQMSDYGERPLLAEAMKPLPDDAKARKQTPIATGFIDYFPRAVAEVARVSFAGNEQHNPGTPLHWDRSKSGDESDALMRHFLERGTLDKDGHRHTAKVAWRAMAMLEKELEKSDKKQVASHEICG